MYDFLGCLFATPPLCQAMSTMAAQQMECERERREAARLKLQLEEAQRDLQRREAMARIPMQVTRNACFLLVNQSRL